MKLIYKICYYILLRWDKFKAAVTKGRLIEVYDIHPTVGIKSTTRIYGLGTISIGEKTYFGTNTFIVSNPRGAKVRIGKGCMISHDVHIRTSQYRIETLHYDPQDRESESKDITIGNNVWIGKGVYIKAGVVIGDNVVIGANSVVVKSIDSNTVVGGILAKVIRKR